MAFSSQKLMGIILCCVLIPAMAHDGFNSDKLHDLTPEEFVSTYSHHRLSSDFILSLYKNLSKGVPLNQATGRPENWRTVKAADTIRAFPAIDAYQRKEKLIYKFNVSQIDHTERLRTVELRLRLPPWWTSRQELQDLSVDMSSNKNAVIYASSIPTVTTQLASDEVTIMDITSAVRDWFDFVRTKKLEDDPTLELVFNVGSKRKMSRNKMLRMLARRSNDEKTHYSFDDAILVTYTKAGEFFIKSESELPIKNITKEENGTSRAIFEADVGSVTEESLGGDVSLASVTRLERSAIFKHVEVGELCLRKDLEIDFLKIGWGEWVVYPTKFNAYQCVGKCGTFPDSRNNPTNHAIVQSLARLGQEAANKVIPMTCCTPVKLSPLNILYLEKGGEVVIKHHQQMIVETCGCI